MDQRSFTIRQKPFWVATLSALAASGLHFYLNQKHYVARFGLELEKSICDFSSTFNCTESALSPFSEFMGIPLATFGLLFNGVLVALLLCYRFYILSGRLANVTPSLCKALAGIIFGASFVMGAITLTQLSSVCPFCLATYALSLVTLVGVFMSFPSPLTPSPSLALYGAGTLVVVLALAALWNRSAMQQYGGKQLVEITDLSVEDWRNKPSQTIETVAPAIHKSSTTPAKMVIVEFADFLCPHCKVAYSKIHAFLKSRPEVEFQFQAYPLDGGCNPGLGPAGNGVRCHLAKTAHCANEQGKGLEIQEKIFEDQKDLRTIDIAKDKIANYAADLALDNDKLQSCIDSEEAHQTVQNQAKLGRSLGIKGTPSIFVNGKMLQGGANFHILEAVYKTLP